MKSKFRIITAIMCAVIITLSLSACNDDTHSTECIEETLLGKPKTVESVEYAALQTEDYKQFKTKVETFASDFAAKSYSDYTKSDNFTVSPISVYMALALSSECAAGDTRSEILDALGVTREQLQTHFSTLYRSLVVEHKAGNKTTGLLNLTNSIWVNQGTQVKQACIESLSNNYYTYSYSTDFANNNKGANRAVRDFVAHQTNGLIDKDFELSEETLFALINTLYLKTVWNTSGEDLPLTDAKYTFTAKDGATKAENFLQGDYISGKAVKTETYSTFYTKTYDGYKIKFILPNDGYTVDDVFTAENIAAVNNIMDYSAVSDGGITPYSTRCIFPEYNCKYDEDVVDVLKQKFGIDLFFKDHIQYSPACDFSTLSEESCFCETIRHVADLTVNRKGIEGTAVTVVGMTNDGIEMTEQQDFVVDRAFGFIITDRQDVTLFSGVVNNI